MKGRVAPGRFKANRCRCKAGMKPVVKNIPEYPTEICGRVGLDSAGLLYTGEYEHVLVKWSEMTNWVVPRI